MFKKAHENLLKWYEENGRHDLPWRQTTNPYQIYISEIMLQQTQVKTVLERFYFPFLEKFPSIEALASAHEDEVLKQWEGLGYYTRARNVHKTAKLCQIALPKTVEELVALPGIGQSTAHAIATFSYHTKVPILDANVKRVLYRVFGVKEAKAKELWTMAYQFFDEENPYEYNQAMMDIGSMVCTKTKPECASCPFEMVCVATDDNPLLYPTAKTKKKVPVKYVNVLVYHHEQKYALHQRTTRFLKGLWGFEQVDRDVVIEGDYIGEVTHQYSHFHVDAKVYLAEGTRSGYTWFTAEEIRGIAISKVDDKTLKLLSKFVRN